MTITCRGDLQTLEQIIKQVAKLIDVVHAIDHTGQSVVETEIALVKIQAELKSRTEVLQIAEHYNAKVVDYGAEALILRVYGDTEKLDSFVPCCAPWRGRAGALGQDPHGPRAPDHVADMAASTFAQAVEAVVNGDEAALRALLRAEPSLVRARSSDGSRPPCSTTSPPTASTRSARPRTRPPSPASCSRRAPRWTRWRPIYDDPYNTPLCLAVTSSVPWQAGVQAKLADVFLDHGAKIDGLTGEGGPLGCALLFGYTRAAERLAVRGARVDNLVYAAGLGRTDLVRHLLATGTGTTVTRRQDDRAGRFSFPIPRAADAREVGDGGGGDPRPSRRGSRPGRRRRRPRLRALLQPEPAALCRPPRLPRGARRAAGARRRPARVDSQTGKTPLEWARDGGQAEIAARLERTES
jgi:hypothetical protein